MADIETLERAHAELSAKEQEMLPERASLREAFQQAKETYHDYALRLKVIRDARAEVAARIAEANKKPRKVAGAADALIQSMTAGAVSGANAPTVDTEKTVHSVTAEAASGAETPNGEA